jgi:DNA segregation ATPase FtsK/SpoIIIE, S-DNA-T family
LRSDKLSFYTAAGFLIIGIFLLVTIVLAIGGPASPAAEFFSRTGRFLYDSFLYLAFYVPLYFFCSSIILLKDDFRKDLLFALNMGILPFFTLSLLLRILLRAETSVFLGNFRDSFGPAGAGILLGLLAVLETVLILQLTRRFFHAGNTDKRASGPAAPSDDGGPKEFALLRDGESVMDLRLFHPRGTDAEAGGEIEELQPAETEDGPSAAGPPLSVDETEAAETPPAEQPTALFRTGGELYEEDAYEEDAYDDEPEIDRGPETVEEKPAAAERPAVSVAAVYELSPEELLSDYPDGQYWKIDRETQEAGDILRHTLEEFKIQAEVTGIRKGPVITMFEILPAPGVKLSKIVNLSDNIALRLAASSVRIVAPIPGKHAVGIEVPNKKRSIVSFKEMLGDEAFQDDDYNLPIVLGKDITGEGQIIDLTQTPHLLIAGATGSGKSVCVNSIICSLLFGKSPKEVRLLLIDPKIVELKLYNDIPHLLTPVITEPKRAFQALQYCLYEMERRYALLDSLGVRDISAFNKKIGKKHLTAEKLPYMVVIIDEFADLMATSGKELESTLARLAAMSRAVGLHLVLATQRPSIDVITGLIKANIPSRIAFMVASKFDSRIIIDSIGAEKLLGKGDMLFTSPWEPFPVRMQGAFLSDEEVVSITDYVKTLGEPDYIDEEIFSDEGDGDRDLFGEGMDDPLIDKAVEIVVTAGKASASYLQRRLKIGYNRAARLVEDMEARGIVGPQNGSKPREILHVPD